MGRDDVIKTLRANRARLEAIGVRHLSLFGSVARGEAGNDVDLVQAGTPKERVQDPTIIWNTVQTDLRPL